MRITSAGRLLDIESVVSAASNEIMFQINIFYHRETDMIDMRLSELSIIFILVLIIFSAGKLPSIGAGLGKGIRNLRRSVSREEPPPETIIPRKLPKP